MSSVVAHDEQHRTRSPFQKLTTSDYAVGICLLLCVLFLWTSSNFVTQYVLLGGYRKPFMVTYLTTATFTLYLLPSYLRKRTTSSLRRNVSYQPLLRNDTLSALRPKTDDRLTPKETANLAVYFGFFWFAGNLALNSSLAYTSVASATILTGMGGIFTLLLGRVFGVETLTLSKLAAVLTSFAGVALVSLSDSSGGSAPEPTANAQSINLLPLLGDALSLLSALSSSIYMIFLKVRVKDESRVDMQLLFGYAGLFNVLLCWPLALLLHWLGIETLAFPSSRELVVGIVLNMFFTLLSDYLSVIAMLKTTPLVVTVGLSLNIPLAVIGDYFLGKPATFQMLVGAVLVISGFVVVGVENSKQKEGESQLPVDDGVRRQACLEEAVLLGS